MRISDWSSDVCSSDLKKISSQVHFRLSKPRRPGKPLRLTVGNTRFGLVSAGAEAWAPDAATDSAILAALRESRRAPVSGLARDGTAIRGGYRSEEHTSELQSPLRNSYAVFCFKKKKTPQIQLTLQTAITTETRVKHASLTLA